MQDSKLVAGTAAGSLAVLAALAGRYAAGVARADRSWPPQVEAGLRGRGEVDEVSILPVVERLTADGSGLAGEPGVSYLIRAGGARGAVRLGPVRREAGVGVGAQRPDARRGPAGYGRGGDLAPAC